MARAHVSAGIVKLVQIDATGCHYLFNTMLYKNKQKHWQETACYSPQLTNNGDSK